MNVVVRNYNDNDYETVDKILFESFGYHKEKVEDDRVYEFVACVDDEIVGYYNMLEETDIVRNLKKYHIGYVCVSPKYRGQGFARRMMEYAIQFAKDHHAFCLELTSGNKREAAHKLYTALDFEKRDTSVFRKELL